VISILPKSHASVEVKGLRVIRGDFQLTADSWSIRPGDIVGLVGANGAGKTSFLRALAGSLPLAAGEVLYNGVDAREFGWKIADLLGIVLDTTVVVEELTLGDHFSLFADVFADWDASYANELAARLNVPLRKRIRALSRGTRVKAAFTIAESYRPSVLVLDEPTSGLDPVIRQELLSVIHGIPCATPSRSVIFSTHILEDIAQVATSVSLVRRGVVYEPQFGNSVDEWRLNAFADRPDAIATLFGVERFS
jgi:ABC-2 type transport system ATP-binding protein